MSNEVPNATKAHDSKPRGSGKQKNHVLLLSHSTAFDSAFPIRSNSSLLVDNLVSEVLQIGIQGSLYSKDDLDDAKKLGITYYTTNAVKKDVSPIVKYANSLRGKTYISLDIDVTDPAFAPGTGTPEVGGLSSFEIMEIVRAIDVDLAGMEVVEVSPPYDVSELTSMLAANLLYEGMSVLAKHI
jgi:agmatinase